MKPKPCPFCRALGAHVIPLPDLYFAVYPKCSAEGPIAKSTAWAIRKWNRRASVRAKSKGRK